MFGFIINLIVGIVLSLASTLIKSIFQQDKKQKVPGVRGSIQTGGDNPLSFIMGFYATAGHLKYAGTWGNSGDTPNAYYSKVVSVSDLPVRGLAGFFVNGERVTLGTTANGSLGYPVLEYRVKGKDHLWVKFYDGTQTAADPLMRAKFGSDSDRPYTSDMIGRGVAYFVATALVNRELFSTFPEYLAEVNGIALDDPRGDDQHDNPMVGVYTLMKGIRYDDEWVYGPQNVTDANFVSANIEAQMDKCDALRTLTGGGTEKRFRFGIEVDVDAEPHAIIGELLKACEGRIAEIGGIYKFLVGEPDEPVVSITDDDIIITEEQNYEPFPGLESLFNGMTATYPEPAEAWDNKEAPPRYRSDLEALDDGRRLPFNTEYKAVPYAVQVQELMRAAIEETRRFRQHTQTMPPEWWEYEPLDAVAWTSTRNGYSAKQFLITAMTDLPNANQFVGLQEIDPDDYDWSSDYELPWDVSPLVIARPAPQLMSGWQALPATIVDNDGTGRRPSIEVHFAGGLVDVRAVRVQVRLKDETGLIYDAEQPYDPEELSPARTLDGVFLPDTDYEARGRFLPFSGRVTRWSNEDEDGTEGEWLAVTTPDVRLSGWDLAPGSVFLDNLEKNVQHAIDDMTLGHPMSVADQNNALRQMIEQAMASLSDTVVSNDRRVEKIEQSLGQALAKIEHIEEVQVSDKDAAAAVMDSIVAQFGNSIASVTELVTTVASEVAAHATSIAQIAVQVGDATANGLLKWEVQASAINGAAASVQLMVRASDGSTYGASGLIANVYNDLTSDFTVVSDKFIVTNAGLTDFAQAMKWEDNVLTLDQLKVRLITSPDGTSMVLDFVNIEETFIGS